MSRRGGFNDGVDGEEEEELLYTLTEEEKGYFMLDDDLDFNSDPAVVNDEDDDVASQKVSEYADAGLFDRGGTSRHSVACSDVVAKEPRTASGTKNGVNTIPAVTGKTTRRASTSSTKENPTISDAGFTAVNTSDILEKSRSVRSRKSTRLSELVKSSTYAESDDGDEDDEGEKSDAANSPYITLRRSTRLSKIAKPSANTDTDNDSNNDDEEGSEDGAEGRIRKISKLNLRIANGEGPKRGAHGPIGEVRFGANGSMEFRDVDNPEWTPAVYHKEYRRRFLDEAARLGQFDHPPSCGTAADDETSFEPSQQHWGPSRSDWQNIVDGEGRKVMFQVEKRKNNRRQKLPPPPENWIIDGCVLLDSKNHPVKNWPGLNKTLSTEIESWRWEALMRLNPRLSVADLLARMPHEREYRGRIVPLQTPQAFTNRAHRFRVPNQIPAIRSKAGSESYRESILTNLAKGQAKTTEGLSVLDPDEVEKIKEKNKGMFAGNSRYVISDDHPPQTQSAAKKRKLDRDDDDDSESETDRQVKKTCVHGVEGLEKGLESSVNGRQSPEDNLSDETRHSINEWSDLDEDIHSGFNIASPEDQHDEQLVPLFASVHDRRQAMLENPAWTSPSAVLRARRAGNGHTRRLGVFWYRASVARHSTPDGNILYDVVHRNVWFKYDFEEGLPGEESVLAYPIAAPVFAHPRFMDVQGSIATAMSPMLDSYGHRRTQAFPAQGLNRLHPTTPTVWESYAASCHAGQPIGGYRTYPGGLQEYWRDHHSSYGF